MQEGCCTLKDEAEPHQKVAIAGPSRIAAPIDEFSKLVEGWKSDEAPQQQGNKNHEQASTYQVEGPIAIFWLVLATQVLPKHSAAACHQDPVGDIDQDADNPKDIGSFVGITWR